MSFLRPEALATLRRAAEPLAFGFVATLGMALVVRGIPRQSLTMIAVGIAIFALGALALYAAVQRLRGRARGEAPGLVEVDERRIAYLGPAGGGFVSLDALLKVEIITTDQGPFQPDVFWVLTPDEGAPLRIPTAASGAEALFDALVALPGVNFEAALRALGSTATARFLIWQRR